MGPGPVVQHVGGQDGSWLFLFPFSRVRFLFFSLLVVGGPTMTGKAGLVPWKRLYIIQLPPTASAAAEPLPWPFGLHVAGYQIQDYTHSSLTSLALGSSQSHSFSTPPQNSLLLPEGGAPGHEVEAGLSLTNVKQPAYVVVDSPYPVKAGPDVRVSG